MKKKRDILAYLGDMLESVELIESYIASVSESEFYNSGGKTGRHHASLADNW